MSLNKSLVTNLISILFILLGYLFQNQYSNLFYSIGFFALSGSVTNWLAVQMLFEKVPFLYGSGVILDRFLDIKEGIKNLVLKELFSDDKINEFQKLAKNLNISILLEMHDKKNISRLKDLNANIIGVNCRNLKTMETDLSLFGKLVNDLPSNSIKVAESGIKTSDDIKYVYDLGYDAILIGTSLMKSGSPGKSLERLISNL